MRKPEQTKEAQVFSSYTALRSTKSTIKLDGRWYQDKDKEPIHILEVSHPRKELNTS